MRSVRIVAAWRNPSANRLHLPLVREHLAGDDVGVERNALVTRRADLDVMAARRESHWLRRRTEVRNAPDVRAVDHHCRGRGRDVEADAAGSRARLRDRGVVLLRLARGRLRSARLRIRLLLRLRLVLRIRLLWIRLLWIRGLLLIRLLRISLLRI